jgi:methylmalonyl-CoA/ethylmalonyl-CoA epimerase
MAKAACMEACWMKPPGTDRAESTAGGRLPADLPGLRGIDHVGVAVPDLEAAIAFYTDVLGLTLLHHEENHDQGVAEAMLGVAAGAGAQVQVMAPLTPTSPIASFLDRSGPGLQQLAYRVVDVEQAAAVLRRRGLRLLYDEARNGTNGSKINFIHPKDAGGVLVELVQPAGDH